MYLCEDCGIWINCSIHHHRRWNEYLNDNYEIRHDCPRRCREVCFHATGFMHQQGWNYYSPLLEASPNNFQPFIVAPQHHPDSWNATSSSLNIGSVSDNYFR